MRSITDRYFRVGYLAFFLSVITVPLSKSISGVCLGIATLFFLISLFKKDIPLIWHNRIFWAILFFCALPFIGLLWTEDIKSGLTLCRRISLVIITYLLCAYFLKDDKDKIKLLKVLVIGVVVLNLLGLIKFFGIWNLKAFSLPSVVIMNPIWFGNVSAISLYASLVIFFILERGKKIWALCSIINALGIVLSASRGPYLAALIVFGVVFLTTFLKEKLMRVFPLLIVIILGIVWFKPEFKQKIFDINDQIKAFFLSSEVKTSIGARLGMWKLSFEMFKDNPILGVGTGDYELEVARRTEGSWSFLRKYNQPHSIYFYFLALYGLIGIGVLFFLFFMWFKESLKRTKNFGVSKAFGILALAVGLHYLLAGLTETLFKIHILVFFFGVMAGVCFTRGKGGF